MTFLAKPAPPAEPPATPKPRAMGETGASTPRPAAPAAARRFFLG